MTMVLAGSRSVVTILDMDDGENYVRFAKDSWYQWMGESLESVGQHPECLEQAYQTWMEDREI